MVVSQRTWLCGILNGEKPQDIPIAISQDVYMFDWTAMQRLGVKGEQIATRQRRGQPTCKPLAAV